MNRTIAIAGTLAALTAAGRAEQVVREYPWDSWKPTTTATSQPVRVERESSLGAVLRIEGGGGKEPQTIHLLTIERPAITTGTYAISGQVRHEAVESDAYLEMWNDFGEGGRYSSKTLAPEGPGRLIKGSSSWRSFVLPFFNKRGGPPPYRLIINLVLPARGKVWIGPLRLTQFADGQNPLAAATVPGQWWSERTAGLWGGIIGSILGVLGGVIGWLVGRGKARPVSLTLLRIEQIGGALLLPIGLYAMLRGQPYAVYYPLLLIGGLCLILATVILPGVRRRYAELELRRMQAMDVV